MLFITLLIETIMVFQYYSDDISLNPLKKDIYNYSWATFNQDAFAAFSVALLTIPQAMAYALLAGLPLSCGLFASIYSAIIAALFCSSRHLVVGPSNTIAILVLAGTSELLFTYYRDLAPDERNAMAVHILTQITLFTALIQLVAASCKLGRLTQFVSHSVITAYVVGTAIAVVVNQMFGIFGLTRLPGVSSLYERGAYIFTHLSEIQLTTALVGFGSLILLVIFKRMDKRIPAGIITFVIASAIVHFTGLSTFSEMTWLSDLLPNLELHQVQLVGDAGEIRDVIPAISIPLLDPGIMSGVLPVAFAIALFSIMETTSVAKTIASNSGQRLSVNQEIFGIGLGNFVSAWIGAMPVSGSPSRSNVNYSNGAKTRFAAILNAIIVATTLYIFGFVVSLIPLASLSALLLVSAIGIVNTKQLFLCLKATRSDAFVLWTTLLACIFLSLDVAFYTGVVLSITLYLKKSAIPQLAEYDLDENGDLINLDPQAPCEPKKIRLIKVEGELFFGAADLFQTTLKTIAKDDTTTCVIILQLKNARDIDATACLALQQLHDYLKYSNRYLVACGLTPPIWDVLSDSGMVEHLGKENLFNFDERRPHLHMQKAFLRAKELVEKHNGKQHHAAEDTATVQTSPAFAPLP